MPAENKNETFEVAIRKVKLQGFGVDESIEVPDINSVNINLEQQVSFSIPDDLVTLVISTKFSVKGTEKIIAHAIVQNTFAIKNLARMRNRENPELLDLPDQLLIMILSISISHSRALMASSLMGTKYQDMYIPIVNPADAMKQLFKAYVK